MVTNIPKQSLLELLGQTDYQADWLGEERLVSGITPDSREVQPGDIFVAWQGSSFDGHRYVGDAIRRGAVAVVGEQDLSPLAAPYIRVENSQAALAKLASALYRYPARDMRVIGVTGTDGKTTTTNLIYQILIQGGLRAGMISTVNAVVAGQELDTGFHVTTPDAHAVQRYLAEMRRAKISHVVLETTSHGLAQHRVDGCEFDIGVVTNITHEHLDYHGTYESYLAAKARLFTLLAETAPKTFGNPRLAVLNRGDRSYPDLEVIAGENQVTYGLSPQADMRAEQIRNLPDGLHFDLVGEGFRCPISTALVGRFNVDNILAAAAATFYGLGLDIDVVASGIRRLRGIPGRMERIDLGQEFTAIVDFAHTPNALQKALETAREITSGKLIAVFGSAGLRDREKRRLMAMTSIELADFSLFTAEDPRTESLDEILAEMTAGALENGGKEGVDFICIPDRGAALRYAVKLAGPGDLVIACGKGHEQSMCFGEVEYPWDDRTAMRAALAEHFELAGPEMPYLPTQSLG